VYARASIQVLRTMTKALSFVCDYVIQRMNPCQIRSEVCLLVHVAVSNKSHHYEAAGLDRTLSTTCKSSKPCACVLLLVGSQFDDASHQWGASRRRARQPPISREACLLLTSRESAAYSWLQVACSQSLQILRTSILGLTPRSAYVLLLVLLLLLHRLDTAGALAHAQSTWLDRALDLARPYHMCLQTLIGCT
jgi:hypothetical protein